MSKPKIVDNKIIYADHAVVGDPTIVDAEYLAEMAEELSEEGGREDHIIELEEMNNDGTWTVEAI